MESNLKRRTIAAGAWHLVGNALRAISQLGVSIILARMLAPEEFGLMAMILLVPAVGRIFVQGGFGIALIHRKNVTRAEETSVFLCNLLLAVLVYLAIWLLAPAVAGFYSQPILTELLRCAAIGLIFEALGLVQSSSLSRQLDFKSLAKANFSASLLGGLCAILMAWAGYGVWALAWQGVLTAAFSTALLWLISKWRPVRALSIEGLKSMAAYGSRMFASNIVTVFFDNLNSILIGRFYSPADLGYYGRAQAAQGMPMNAFATSISQVMVPSLVHVNDKPQEFRRAYRRALQAAFGVSAPLMIGAMVLAEPLFALVFSEKWLPAVPYFQVLCLAGTLYPLHLLNISILLALGRPELYLKLELIKRMLSLCIALIAIQHSVFALAVSAAVASPLMLAINAYYPGKLAGLGLRTQLKALMPYAAIAATAAAIVSYMLPYLPESYIVRLGTGGAAYLLLLLPGIFLLKDNIYRYLMVNNPLQRSS